MNTINPITESITAALNTATVINIDAAIEELQARKAELSGVSFSGLTVVRTPRKTVSNGMGTSQSARIRKIAQSMSGEWTHDDLMKKAPWADAKVVTSVLFNLTNTGTVTRVKRGVYRNK